MASSLTTSSVIRTLPVRLAANLSTKVANIYPSSSLRTLNTPFKPRSVRIFFKMNRNASNSTTTTATAASVNAQAATEQQAFTIIGGGRVGQAISEMGQNDVVLGRGQPIEGPAGPIIICTRNDDLAAIVEATPPSRRKDLVFIQNGMLQPWLDARGLGDNTQVLVYFAVAKKGDSPTDGKTDINPEGLTAAYGPHAEAFAARLHASGLSCKVLDRTAFQKSMLEKLIWICSFMLVGAKNGGCLVGEVEANHRAEVEKLIGELANAGSAALGVSLDAGVEERLCAYARSVAHFPTAVKEFDWRNGWFYGLSKSAMDAGKEDPCPTHTAWLKEVGTI
jgi:hypothetical protein